MGTFPANIQSSTPAKYLFKLISPNQTIVCDTEPLEWQSGQFVMNRDLEVGGVFTSFQFSSLTFVGNSAALLRNLYTAYELNAECELAIYYFKNSSREYVEFPSRFALNFTVYEVVKVGKFAFGIRVKAVNSSIQTKFDNRKDIEVDIKKLVSIGGFAIKEYTDLRKKLLFDSTNIFYYGEMAGYSGHNGWDLPRYSGTSCYASVPFTDIVKSEYTELNTVKFVNRVININNIPKFFTNSKFLYEDIELSYLLYIAIKNSHGGTPPWTLQLIETNPANVIIQTIDLETWGTSTDILEIKGSTTLTIQKFSDLRLVIKTGNISGIKCLLFDTHIKLNQTVAQSPSKLTQGFPLYETIERNCQHILDTQYPVYSEFFGRNENVYNSLNNYYSAENQLRFAHIQTGVNLRGQSLDDKTGTLPIKFNDLFKTIKSIWNVGYAFETIENSLRLRIEEYSYFFDGSGSPSLDLSGRINKYDIVSIVMPELVPVQINSGFNDFEYLQINGRAEPNTTNQRTSKINTDTKLENISPYRGDTKGILTALATPIDTTDTKSDNGIYITKTQRDGTRWKPERDENITIVDDSSVFKEDQLNRYFTPTRMLIRQGNRITSGFTTSDLKASKFVFQTSDKLQTLKTTGEGFTISENEDILISNLSNPIYKPIKHTVECSFDYQDLEAIKALPYRWIKFSETISGYLLNLKKKNNEAKAEITIIQRYVS